MSKRSQQEKAEALLALHRGGDLLVLPNIWDPIGADPGGERISGRRDRQRRGFGVVGLSGWREDQRSTLIDLLGRIVRSVDVPVTADIETGYGESLAELELTAGRSSNPASSASTSRTARGKAAASAPSRSSAGGSRRSGRSRIAGRASGHQCQG